MNEEKSRAELGVINNIEDAIAYCLNDCDSKEQRQGVKRVQSFLSGRLNRDCEIFNVNEFNESIAKKTL